MTNPPEHPDDVVDDGVSDVFTEDQVVHVPPAVAELAESIQHHGQTFVTDVPDWDEPDPRP
ncbi:MAG TPA: hypothetical protein VF163_14340 [Micromonosporaceae bacterium]